MLCLLVEAFLPWELRPYNTAEIRSKIFRSRWLSRIVWKAVLTFPLRFRTWLKRLSSSSRLNLYALSVGWKKKKPNTVWIATNCGKFLKRLEYHTSLLRNLFAGQEATVRTKHGTMDWFQIGKGVLQGCILSPWLFNLYADYIMRNTGLDEAQVGIKIAGRNINNLRYADDTTLMAGSEEEMKSLLMKGKRGVKKLT